MLRKQIRINELKEKGEFQKPAKRRPDEKTPNFKESALQETSYYYRNGRFSCNSYTL